MHKPLEDNMYTKPYITMCVYTTEGSKHGNMGQKWFQDENQPI